MFSYRVVENSWNAKMWFSTVHSNSFRSKPRNIARRSAGVQQPFKLHRSLERQHFNNSAVRTLRNVVSWHPKMSRQTCVNISSHFKPKIHSNVSLDLRFTFLLFSYFSVTKLFARNRAKHPSVAQASHCASGEMFSLQSWSSHSKKVPESNENWLEWGICNSLFLFRYLIKF